ncbi:MAG: tyrosine-type recombinase/integrase [Thermoplasmata archaeon]|nr:tyrosine-type recombinase/integrase [Thermoplasmata archaeon]
MVEIEMGRGLTLEECLMLCNTPRMLPVDATEFQMWKHLRDEILIRLIYETFARIGELLEVEVRDVDFEHCAIRIAHPKGKAVFKIIDGRRKHARTIYPKRWVYFGEESKNLLIRNLGRRRRGYLITNSRGRKLSTRQAERTVDFYARKAGIQKTIGHTKNGREIRLLTCKALREAGERHTDTNGGDRDATARIAGHTVRTKEKYYKKGNFEEDGEVVRRHHPLMKAEKLMEGQ